MSVTHSEAVALVIEFLKERGHGFLKPRKTNANGPDIIAVMKNDVARIEVKVAARHGDRESWRVRKVEENRKSDDFVAIVFPSKHIHFETMESWLLDCTEDGSKTVTRLASIIEG